MPAKNPAVLPYSVEAVADAIHAQLDQAAAARGRCSLAIPGGRSPGPVLTALAKQCSPFVRDNLHLLWVDERAVPVGHDDRNDAATLAAWEAGGARPAYVHAMPAEADDLELAANQYAATLNQATGDGTIDVAFLGIGEDGHLASLFPNHPGLDELSLVFPVTDSPKPPARRLTVSMGVIRSARNRIALALGPAKGAVVAEVNRTGQQRQLPISLAGAVQWFADDEALAAIQGSPE